MGKGWTGDTFRQGRGLEDRYCVFFLGTSQPRYLRQFPCARFAGAA